MASITSLKDFGSLSNTTHQENHDKQEDSSNNDTSRDHKMNNESLNNLEETKYIL